MADLYLLFADELAQRIAEGRKTVTRRPMTKANCRPVTYANSHLPDGGGFADLDWDAHLITGDRQPPQHGATACTDRCAGRDYCCCLIDYSGTPEFAAYLKVPGKGGETRQRVFCRHSPKDTLIVREGFWQTIGQGHIDENGEYHRGPWTRTRIHYNAEGPPASRYVDREQLIRRPSIHMPRWAARSVRNILSIRPDLVGPEPLSQEEAEREGFDSPEAFAAAWAGMYGAKHGPRVWTWRYEFEAGNG